MLLAVSNPVLFVIPSKRSTELYTIHNTPAVLRPNSRHSETRIYNEATVCIILYIYFKPLRFHYRSEKP